MVRRSLHGLTLLVLLALAQPFVSMVPVRAAAPRTVTARVACARVIGEASGLPKIEATIKNRTGAPLRIGYLRAFGTAQNLEGGFTGLAMSASASEETITVEDGQTRRFPVEWGGVALKRSDAIVALIVTNAGLLLPGCGEQEPRTLTLPADAPADDDAATVEAAARGAEMIGQLESLRAYPALYALMHPDGRAAVSLEAMTCWYLGQFGPPVTPDTPAVVATTVESVRIADWTWGVNGKIYPDAAEVKQTQEIGVPPKGGEAETATIHLVEEDGIWRWFFGATREGIAGLTESCAIPEAV